MNIAKIIGFILYSLLLALLSFVSGWHYRDKQKEEEDEEDFLGDFPHNHHDFGDR